MSVRRNEVAIARLAPGTVGTLFIRLTPARAARLAYFTLRTGISVEDLILDLLDDVIFDMGERCSTSIGSDTRTLPISLGGAK